MFCLRQYLNGKTPEVKPGKKKFKSGQKYLAEKDIYQAQTRSPKLIFLVEIQNSAFTAHTFCSGLTCAMNHKQHSHFSLGKRAWPTHNTHVSLGTNMCGQQENVCDNGSTAHILHLYNVCDVWRIANGMVGLNVCDMHLIAHTLSLVRIRNIVPHKSRCDRYIISHDFDRWSVWYIWYIVNACRKIHVWDRFRHRYDLFFLNVCTIEAYRRWLTHIVCDGAPYHTPSQGDGSKLCQRKRILTVWVGLNCTGGMVLQPLNYHGWT